MRTDTSPTRPAQPETEPAARPKSLPGPRRRHPLALSLVGLLVLLAIGAYVVSRLGIGSSTEAPLTGTLEVTEVGIAAEAPGRVVAVEVDEGDVVRREQLLIRLDDSALQTQFRQADASQRQLLQIQIDNTQLRSPLDGIVVRRAIEPGEVVASGARLMTVADLSTLDLTLYVHERDLSRVRVGQHVVLTTDAYPGRVFDGTVASVATTAEFTPRNVQTKQDRVNLVFAVRVRVPNPDGDLRPGMPVDARLDGFGTP